MVLEVLDKILKNIASVHKIHTTFLLFALKVLNDIIANGKKMLTFHKKADKRYVAIFFITIIVS